MLGEALVRPSVLTTSLLCWGETGAGMQTAGNHGNSPGWDQAGAVEAVSRSQVLEVLIGTFSGFGERQSL